MKKKNIRVKSFFQKLRFRYRVSVLNENTLEESWHIRLSRLSVMVYASVLVLSTFALLALLIYATPIKYYLPGYGDSGNRGKIIAEAMKTDSLVQQVKLQEGYIDILKAIVTGNMKSDSVASLDSAQLKETAHVFVEKSNAEKEFVDNFENEEIGRAHV